MNTLNRALPATIELPTTGTSRKDVLGLSTFHTLLKGRRTTVQWLIDLGFGIRRPHRDHWVLTHTTALPELHFYSDLELERFATGKAREYAKRILRETSQ